MRFRLATVVFVLAVSAFASRFLIGAALNSDSPITVFMILAIQFALPVTFVYLCWDELLLWLEKCHKLETPAEVDSERLAELDNSQWWENHREIGPPVE